LEYVVVFDGVSSTVCHCAARPVIAQRRASSPAVKGAEMSDVTASEVPVRLSSNARAEPSNDRSINDHASDDRDGVTLSYPSGQHRMSITRASRGASGIGLGTLLTDTGMVTLDPGFVNTAACTSEITYIDGDAGVLRYRGYPIGQLAERSTFLETSYLLIYGDLPTSGQLENFTDQIRIHTLLHEDLRRFFDGFPRDAHPMPVLSSAVSALSTFYQDSLNPFDHEQVEISTVRLLAKLPTIAAYAYKKSIGQPFLYPDNSLSLVHNFLRMTFGLPTEPYQVDPVMADGLDQLFILHADHEQNCSTSTVRMVGSSQANLFASVSAGINALFGPQHGGANQAVLEMLERIRIDGGDVDTFVKKAKNREDGVRLMGFGHRVYKNYDPRAKIVKKTADEILHKLGVNDPLLDIALALEEKALADDYFVERRLYPNVDFYTGLIYRAMGFPIKMFTVLFALGRLPGWIAHWREMINDPQTKIGRPCQVYTGHAEREYVAVTQR
jgi:citrate synthase